MDIKTERSIEVNKINGIETEDQYAEEMELFKRCCPSFALT
jgi:hypothetical protein